MVVAVCAAVWGTTAAAQYTIDQNQPIGTTYIAAFSQTDLAQSFQPGVGQCAGAGIMLQAGAGSTDTVTIQLWTGLPNAGGTMLAQGSAQGTAGQWVDVYWTAVPVTVGQTYYLVFTGNTTLGIAGSIADPYPNGICYANAGYQAFPAFDYAFRTYGAPAEPIPTLGHAGLIGLAALLLAVGVAALRRLA